MSKTKKLYGLKTTIQARIMRFFLISIIETILIFLIFFCFTLYNLTTSNAKEEAVGYAESYSDSISGSVDLLRYQIEKVSENPNFYDTTLSIDDRKKITC